MNIKKFYTICALKNNLNSDLIYKIWSQVLYSEGCFIKDTILTVYFYKILDNFEIYYYLHKFYMNPFLNKNLERLLIFAKHNINYGLIKYPHRWIIPLIHFRAMDISYIVNKYSTILSNNINNRVNLGYFILHH